MEIRKTQSPGNIAFSPKQWCSLTTQWNMWVLKDFQLFKREVTAEPGKANECV